MIESYIEKLDPRGHQFVTETLAKVNLDGMQIRRQTKNPEGDYNSEAIDIEFNFKFPHEVSISESGDISMCVTFVQEANLLISFLTTGVLHSMDYKIRKFNMLERFNRLLSIKLKYDYDKKPFMKRETADVD